MASHNKQQAPFGSAKQPKAPDRKLQAHAPTTMSLILATHVDENVNLVMRLDKAASPDGSMLTLDGILQSHPVVANAFIMIVPPKDGQPAMTHEIDADDVVDCISRAPQGLFEVLVARAQAKAAKDDREAQEMSARALEQLGQEAGPKIVKP
jgi:hypothetical protein